MNWLLTCDRTASDSLGGMTVTLIETGKQMVRAGDSVYWVTGRLNESLPDSGQIEGLELYSHPSYQINLRNLLSLRSFFRSQVRQLIDDPGIDAAVIHQPIAGEAVGPLLSRSGIPSCYFFHSPWAREFEIQTGKDRFRSWPGWRFRKGIEARAIRSFNKIVVFSRTMADQLLREHPSSPIPLRVTPGIDLERFRPVSDRTVVRKRLGWPDTGVIILTVRRLVPRMGMDILIEALGRLKGSISDTYLLIGGTGPQESELKELALRSGISDRIRFLGYIPDEDLVEAYGAADLVVMPTRVLEGLGLVTLEAMACGTCVVATPVGGNVELLEPFRPDLIADDVSAEGLARVLHRTISTGSDSLHRLGLEARSHVESRYTWERTTEDLRNVLGLHQ